MTRITSRTGLPAGPDRRGGLSYPCDLCGLDCGPGTASRLLAGHEHTFCCAGCLNVYAILLESGVVQPGVDLRDTELFRRSRELGLVSNRPEAAKPVISPNTESRELLLHVSGMWCSSCAWLIEHSLLREPGVATAEVFFASDLLRLTYYPQYLPPDRVPARIQSLGYRVSEYKPGGEAEEAQQERRDLTLRLGVAAFLWVNVMVLNLSVYVGYFQHLPDSIHRVLPFVVMILAAPVILYSAQPILRAAWAGLRHRVVRMETLLAMGVVAAYSYSVIQVFQGGTHIYFDIACAIVTLVLIGKYIERGAKEKASHAIASLYRMLPNKARVLADGRERFVSIEALQPGQLFLVKAGERIPADGVVNQGESHADESLLTGESAPVAKQPGDAVVCGSMNISGVLTVRATTVREDSTLAQILKTVELALRSRSNVERTADRASRAFVPAVIVLAALTFLGACFLLHQNTGDALMRAVTVLVIACPCALGIATPMAVTAAVTAASRRGILVGDSRVLETLGKVDTIVLDKTGTVTEGSFELVEGPRDDLALLASLEANSEHPLGKALVREAERSGLTLQPASNVQIHKGHGITGTVAGREIFIGNRSLVGEASWPVQAATWEARGLTVAFYGWDGDVRGALGFGDRLKPGARELVTELKRRGMQVLLVSGDSRATTQWTAEQIGVDRYESEALPSGKLDILARLRSQGRIVAMVGDGINDAPALAKANLGIAMGSGASITMHAAAMIIVNNQLRRVPEAFDLASAAMRVIRQNLFWAFFYNISGISFAVAGILNPIVAAGAMIVSSLFVIGNSHRLK